MYAMCVKELTGHYKPPSLYTYKRECFKKLAYHIPTKKDTCSLCMTYREGNDQTKEKLQYKYGKNISEKEKVKNIKDECKEKSKSEKSVLTLIPSISNK